MPLTISEAKRLSRRTGMNVDAFTWENNGVLTLLNDETTRACVFLLTASSDPSAEGMCSVYEVRPEGCRKYPIVLNPKDEAILDDGCPHRSQFPQPNDDDAIALLNLEERLMRR
jgi:Fe-S-cluster containining protein